MRNFVFALLFISSTALGQENKFLDYLRINKSTIDLNSDNQWDMLKIDAEQAQFIILGESHGTQAAQLVDFNLLKYLNKTVGTKNYIAELDFAQAATINEYHQVPIYFLGDDFASRLISSDLPISKKVITVLCMPINSKYNVWDEKSETWTKKPFSYDDKTLFQVDGIEDVKQLSTNNPTTLFKLNGPNSPFPKTGRLFNGSSPQGKVMGDFRLRDYAYQYLVIIRNSDWLNPLPPKF